MAFDGIVINHLIKEFNEKLLGGKIDKIYQPDDHTVIFKIRGANKNYKWMWSIHPMAPMVIVTEENSENPLTAPNFCMLLRKYITNGRIISIEQPLFERMIEMRISHMNDFGEPCEKRLIIEMMGKHSNLIFLEEDRIIDSLKKVSKSMSSVRQVYPGITYVLPPSQDKLSPLLPIDFDTFQGKVLQYKGLVFKSIYMLFNGISPAVATELCQSAAIDAQLLTEQLSEEQLQKLYNEFIRFTTLLNTQGYTGEIYTGDQGYFIDFSSYPLDHLTYTSKQTFASPSEMVLTYYGEKIKTEMTKQKGSDIAKLVHHNLDRCKKKYDLQMKQLEDSDQREEEQLFGELITANLYQMHLGDKQLTTLNYYNDTTITIPLDEHLTPNENAQRYYQRYQKKKRTFEALTTQIEETKKELNYLESVSLSLTFITCQDDIELIRRELKNTGYIKKIGLKDKNLQKSKPLHFISSDGFHIYVGKNNLQNDDLTHKFAESKDWWFHTKEVHGSHVIVKSEGKELTDKTFEEAAGLAAYYSQARESTKVTVDYTQKKNLKKPAAANPGFVIYHTNFSVHVKPSIEALKEIK